MSILIVNGNITLSLYPIEDSPKISNSIGSGHSIFIFSTFDELSQLIVCGKPPPPGDFQYVFQSFSKSYSKPKSNSLELFEVVNGAINLTFDLSPTTQSLDNEKLGVVNSPNASKNR